MGCFSKKEIDEAARLCADAEARIADISRRAESATTPEQHVQLRRERGAAFADFKQAGFILTEDGAS